MLRLSNLDPRTKMVMIAGISTASMGVKNLWLLLGLLLFTILLLLLGGVDLKRQIRQARTAVGMVAFLFVLQTVFGQMELGALLCVRLMILIMSALILLTGEARDYLLGLVQMKVPYEIAYMVMIGLHFFPLLREEALDVYYSIQLRGTELKKISLRKKLQVYMKICLPILSGAMERAKDTSISMEARAFRAFPKRTYMRKLKLKMKDKLLILLFPVLTVLFLFSGCGSGETPSQVILSQTAEPSVSQAISWYGKEEYEGQVRYGETEPDRTETAEVTEVRPDEYYRYKACIKDLKPSTTYYYQVGSKSGWSETRTFTTAPDPDADSQESFSCLFMGDIQYQVREEDYKAWGSRLSSAFQANPQIRFGLLSGDMVDKSGDVEDWSMFFSQGTSVFSQIPMAAVPGNHETSIIPYTYLQMLPVPQTGPVEGELYSFDYGSAHFIMLNSCLFMDERIRDMGQEAWEEQTRKVEDWLKRDLEESQAAWNIAVFHHPLYPVEEDDEIYARIRESWEPILAAGGTDLVLCGHQHCYMRTKDMNGITCIMGNAGEKQSYYYEEGSPLPDYVQTIRPDTGTYQILTVSSEKLKVEAFDGSGDRLDLWEKQADTRPE